MASEQRRGLVEDYRVNEELDHIHRRINRQDYPSERRIFENYQVLLEDRLIACMRNGLTLTLPRLSEKDNGQILFFIDKSGIAGTSAITLLAPDAYTVNGAVSTTISSNYGFKKLRFDFADLTFYIVG